MIKFSSALDSIMVDGLPKKEAVLKKEAVPSAEILGSAQKLSRDNAPLDQCADCVEQIAENTAAMWLPKK